jgi:hypothetical protein
MHKPQYRTIATAGMFGVLYVILFHISDLILDNVHFGGFASLLFLPAFIRLLGYLMVGPWIIPALFLASYLLVVTGAYDIAPGNDVEHLVSASTAIGGPLGVAVASRLARLQTNLANLTPLRLLALSFACSAGNALFYYASLRLTSLGAEPASSIFAIFAGDMLGTWMIIYVIKLAVDFLPSRLGK